jgi:pilus assembly protein CpaB
VLAIDQAPKEKEGTNTLVGRTATLELKPEQAETLVRARQTGTLALALRSITDSNATAEGLSEEQVKKRSESVNVVRYGIANQTTAQK